MGRRKIGGLYQTGHEHDGRSFDEVVAAKFAKAGGETRAVRRDRLHKALRYWARGQLRHWKADWEVYGPMMAEIDEMWIKSGRPIAEVKAMILDRVTGRSFELGTSTHQKNGGRDGSLYKSTEKVTDSDAVRELLVERENSPTMSQKELRAALKDIINDAPGRRRVARDG